jgi:hypothetical protein
VLLVDTSAWIELLRKPARLRPEDIGDLDEIVTCLPVVQEVLQGVRDEAAFRQASSAMWAFPIVESPLGRGVVEEAVDLYRAARRAGLTIRSSVDCLIAACALRHGLAIVHVDRDFASLAQVAPLEERALRLRTRVAPRQ